MAPKGVANAAMSATVNEPDLQAQITDLEAQLQTARGRMGRPDRRPGRSVHAVPSRAG
jgi:hypothetical protein